MAISNHLNVCRNEAETAHSRYIDIVHGTITRGKKHENTISNMRRKRMQSSTPITSRMSVNDIEFFFVFSSQSTCTRFK